jgi:hypothetical protein
MSAVRGLALRENWSVQADPGPEGERLLANAPDGWSDADDDRFLKEATKAANTEAVSSFEGARRKSE